MSSPFQLSLLRRTFAAIAAAAFVFTASDALAQGNKIKLSGGNNKDECEFSSMSITPAGGVTVQCSGTVNPPPPPPTGEVFTMGSAAISAAANSIVDFVAMRTGPAGYDFPATAINFQYSGAGCKVTGTYQIPFAAGQQSVPFQGPVGASGTCTAALMPPAAPASLGTPSSTVVTLPGGTSPPNPGPGGSVPPGCPALPQGSLNATFVGLGNPLLQMQGSGQIVAIPLPSMQSSGQVSFGESAGGAYTPQPVTLEVSINKCPGAIESDYSNRCNIRSTNGNINSITWLAKAYQGRGGTIDATTASSNGLCWAGGGDQYYINARWSYAQCAFGAQVCGFAIQYNLGGY
jgi:hypothetical protein